MHNVENSNLNNKLDKALFKLLSSGDHFSEFQLINRLSASPDNIFTANCLHTTMGLFQTHFVLFNALYRLDDLGFETGTFYLNIHVLDINMQLIKPNSLDVRASIADQELRDYYLNWENLEKTNQLDVEQLLGQFWRKFSETPHYDETLVASALTYFNYPSLPKLSDVKQDFRRLSLRLHPDMGGDSEAFSTMLNHYRVLKVAIAEHNSDD